MNVSCSGFKEARSKRSLGLLSMADSIGVFATQSYLCVSVRCSFAHQLGRRDL